MIQLTPELQAAVAPIQALAAQNQPAAPSNTPGQDALSTGIPTGAPTATSSLAGPLQNALSNPINGVPLSFNDKLHANTNAAAESTPPAEQGKPGSWAKQLVAGAQASLSKIQTGLGDAAAAAPAKGLLGGIGAVQNARADRIQKERKAQTEEDQARASIAHENIQTMYQQRLLHQLGDKENEEDITNGKAAIDNFTTHLSELGIQPAPVLAKDITEDQLQKAIKDQNLDPSYNHFWPTGSYQPLDPKTGKPMVDKDGNPVKQKLYTVVGNIPEVKLSAKNAELINNNVSGMDFKEGQPLTGAQAGSLIQQAMNHQAITNKIDLDRENADVAKLSLDQKKAQLTAVNNLGPDFGRVLAQSDGDVEAATKYMTGQHQVRKIVNGKVVITPDLTSAQMAKDHPNAYKDIMDAFGGAVEYAKIIDTQHKEQEQIRHDQAEEAEKAQAERDKKAKDSEYIGDENASGAAFLNSLQPNEKSVVEAIGTGHVVADRLGYLLSKSPNLVAAVTKAYPEFDSSKASGYAKVVQDFTSGKTSATLTAGGTALKHAKRLYDVSGPEGFIPGTTDYADRQKTLTQLASEVARFNAAGGEPGQGSIADIKNSLDTVIRPREGIKQLVRLLSDNLQTYQNKWDEGAPSDAYHKPMPKLDQEAKDSAGYVLSDGKAVGSQKPKPPSKPVPTGMTRILASDQTYHDIPSGNLTAAQKIDPKLQVIGQ